MTTIQLVHIYLSDKDRYVPDNTSVHGWDGLRYDYGNFYASNTSFDPSKKRRNLWGLMNLILLKMRP